ncbi:5-formyltetrahydrofolate cyclo-ligase [Halogranum amylolyticum]|uniref:5-formyltetrahydrofolate cyclo-ligase n=1 Tax=Halogranum amylolyticum TaxID=660520 RepID=A0A1H8TRM7_9EURY|nr:5-formyltetrahydrofolate cyclo-ligase [Halogranum amylolyticum]SEO93274.1 5-formyltetrahydrofolate cyclo-ligase [Halogranum amylolyticum]
MDKQALRERIWDELEESGEARFPFPPHGRIPNFAGASEAANRLADTDAWRATEVLKANPDAPQLPIRRRALHEGKVVYMAQPRLRDEKPFMKLDPTDIDEENLDDAATVSKMDGYAEPVGPGALPHVDLVVSGSVAVTEQGARVGKGEGYSDLEFAVLAELDAVDAETTVATSVHEVQVVDARDAPDPEAHDVPMDLLVTPDRLVRTDSPYPRPDGVDWDLLDAERREEIPVLSQFAP